MAVMNRRLRFGPPKVRFATIVGILILLPWEPGSENGFLGVGLGVFSAFLFALRVLIQKKTVQYYPSSVSMAYQLAAGCVVMWLWWPGDQSQSLAREPAIASDAKPPGNAPAESKPGSETQTKPAETQQPYRPFSQLPAGSAEPDGELTVQSNAGATPQREPLRIETAPGERVIAPPGSRPIVIEQPAPTAEPTAPATAPPESEAETDAEAETETARSADAAAAPAAIDRSAFIPLTQLDGAARSRFPTFSVSTHVYASDADLRAVVVDRQRLLEGDEVAGLPLEHITETGIVVRFEGQLIEVSVIDDWE